MLFPMFLRISIQILTSFGKERLFNRVGMAGQNVQVKIKQLVVSLTLFADYVAVIFFAVIYNFRA